jgi:hypothetical protein
MFRGPEPTVEAGDRQVTLSELAWNCPDFLPGDYADLFEENPGTYAQAARLLKREIERSRSVAGSYRAA